MTQVRETLLMHSAEIPMNSKKPVLLTRPLEKCGPMKDVIEKMGYFPVLAPLLEIAYLTPDMPEDKNHDALVFTSMFGVKGFVENTKKTGRPFAGLPVFAIGDETARQARLSGFTHVTSARGDGHDLIRLITFSLQKGKLLHPCAQTHSRKLNFPENSGLSLDRLPVYRAAAAQTLPETATHALQSEKTEAVLLFSPRTAQILVKILHRLNLEQACAHLRVLCLSAEVARASSVLPWQSVEIAAHPDQESLLSLL